MKQRSAYISFTLPAQLCNMLIKSLIMKCLNKGQRFTQSLSTKTLYMQTFLIKWPSHFTATKQAHSVVKPRLMMLRKWNVTLGTIPSLAEAWLRPCDDNKPASTQSSVWTAFRSACLVSDSLHCGLGIRLWLWAQHIASSAPNTAGSPGPCSYTSTTSGPQRLETRQERQEISVGRLHGVR